MIKPSPRPAQEAETVMVEALKPGYDRPLMIITLILMGFGVVMVYAASLISAEQATGDSHYYLKRQAAYALVALAMMAACAQIPYDVWRRLAPLAVLIGALALIAVLIPGVAANAKGASRWIKIGPLRFQPSELIKLVWLMWLAKHLTQIQPRVERFTVAWLPPIGALGLIGGLLMIQPDFGSTMICAGLMVLMLWIAGARMRHLLLLALLGVLFVVAAIIDKPYRLDRIIAFLYPERDPLGVGFHITQAMISFSSGAWSGLGLGMSQQKLLYLAEAHTDFIFCIIGEELGLRGVLLLIGLYGFFIWRGLKIAAAAPDVFGRFLAFGITAEIGFQAFVNMGVATALLPTKGLTLPFISYGGSSILLLGVSVGVLLNISKGQISKGQISKGQPAPSWVDRIPEIDGARLWRWLWRWPRCWRRHG
ncbi:putative lipid II flippase FtsW [Myxococcota bacterium]|nr:putative lipid II flippase FtsW [Myxococcota bacterium]MBU1897856.1 putative lipid II flippase FtsW [Myxococcota bacterium]